MRWEEGINRICDTRLLKDDSILNDKWERFRILFRLHHPLKEDQKMYINGSDEKLGAWNKEDGGPQPMKLGDKVEGLTEEQVTPWQFDISTSVHFKKIIYRYLYHD